MRLRFTLCSLVVLLGAASSARAQPGPFDGPWTESESPAHKVLPSQVKVAYMLLRDLEGNRNGVIDDGAPTNLSTAAEWDALERFMKKKATSWGVDSVTNLQAGDFPSKAKYRFFCLEKALFLDRHGWKPGQVKDDFLDVTKAKVKGEPVADARVFVQTITPPEGKSNGVVYAGLAGYNNTHLNMYHVAEALVGKGSAVVLGDQYWAGLDTGRDVHKGGVPSGETIALTMYDVAGWAHHAFPTRNLAVMGHSLGGGLGVWGMSFLNGKGELSAEITGVKGDSIAGSDLVPRNTPGAPLSAFLQPTPNVADRAIEVVGRIPGLSTLEVGDWLTASGATNLDDLKAVLEGAYDQAESMDAVLPFAHEIVAAVLRGEGPTNPMFGYHSYADTLAFFEPILLMHTARGAQGLVSDLTVAPGNVHNILNVPEMARQAAESFLSRTEAWFQGETAALALRVAPVVAAAQVPGKGGFLAGIERFIVNGFERLTGHGGAPDAVPAPAKLEDLPGRVQAELRRFGTRPPRGSSETAGLRGVLDRSIDDAVHPERAGSER